MITKMSVSIPENAERLPCTWAQVSFPTVSALQPKPRTPEPLTPKAVSSADLAWPCPKSEHRYSRNLKPPQFSLSPTSIKADPGADLEP